MAARTNRKDLNRGDLERNLTEFWPFEDKEGVPERWK